MRSPGDDDVPRWMLFLGPFVVLGLSIGPFVLAPPLGDLDGLSAASTTEVFWTMVMIGLIVGIIPVAIGMRWVPFLRTLQSRYVHNVLALSAGVLAFVAVEMTEEAIQHAGGTPPVSSPPASP